MSELVGHLDTQIESARKLLRIMAEQADAIRRRDADGVLAGLADVQIEFFRHERLEHERQALVRDAAGRLGVPSDGVELDALMLLVQPEEADEMRRKSAELNRLDADLIRVQSERRMVIRERLTFLDELVRTLSTRPRRAFRPTDPTSSPLFPAR